MLKFFDAGMGWEEKACVRTSPDGTALYTAPLYTRGLANLGNTCFLNSILQAVASCPSFLSYIEAMTSVAGVAGVFTEKLHRCLRDIRSSRRSYGSFNPRAILNMLTKFNPEIAGYEQQDALETLESMLSLVKEEVDDICKGARQRAQLKQVKFTHSLVPSDLQRLQTGRPGIAQYENPFQGWICSHLMCQACAGGMEQVGKGALGLLLNPVRHQLFTTLPLPIPPSRRSDASAPHTAMGSFAGVPLGGGLQVLQKPRLVPTVRSSSASVYSCLDDFFRTEQLDGVSCSNCAVRLGIDQLEKKAVSGSDACDEDELEITETVLREMRSLRTDGESDCFLAEVEKGRKVSIFSPLTQQVEPIPSAIADKLFHSAVQARSSMETGKRTAISRLPSLLCICLCRRVYDEGTREMRKINHHVTFPIVLRMGEYCNSNAALSVHDPPRGDRSNEGLGLGAFGGLPTFRGLSATASTAPGNYLLRAVVVHRGDAESGHYVAYCLVREQPREWEMFSDEQHTRVSEADVLSSQAALLFYDKISR